MTTSASRAKEQPEQVELANRLRMAVFPLTRQLRQHAAEPFTATQLSVLGSIAQHGPISLGDLATRERLSAPMISKVVAALEDHQVIERSVDVHDRRVCFVKLSPAGERWVEEGRAKRNAWLARQLAALDADELAAVAAAVPALEHLIGDDT